MVTVVVIPLVVFGNVPGPLKLGKNIFEKKNVCAAEGTIAMRHGPGEREVPPNVQAVELPLRTTSVIGPRLKSLESR